jgi:hypothetical protein
MMAAGAVAFVDSLPWFFVALALTFGPVAAASGSAPTVTSTQIGVQVDPCIWQAAVLSNTTDPATQATDVAASAAVTMYQTAASWLNAQAAAGTIVDTSGIVPPNPASPTDSVEPLNVSDFNAKDPAQTLTVLNVYLGDVPQPDEAPGDTRDWTGTLTTQLGVVGLTYNRLVTYAG